MANITLNSYLFEKAMHQVVAAAHIAKEANRIDPTIKCGPDTLRDCLLEQAFTVYEYACLFIAYTSGHLGGDEFASKIRQSFNQGPKAMKAYANALFDPKAAETGWELPHPLFHSTVIPIVDPRSHLDS